MLFSIVADIGNHESLTRTRVASAPEFQKSQMSELSGHFSSPLSCRSRCSKGAFALIGPLPARRGASEAGLGAGPQKVLVWTSAACQQTLRQGCLSLTETGSLGPQHRGCFVLSSTVSSGWESTSQGQHEVSTKTGAPVLTWTRAGKPVCDSVSPFAT